jgi:hypothetical protein
MPTARRRTTTKRGATRSWPDFDDAVDERPLVAQFLLAALSLRDVPEDREQSLLALDRRARACDSPLAPRRLSVAGPDTPLGAPGRSVGRRRVGHRRIGQSEIGERDVGEVGAVVVEQSPERRVDVDSAPSRSATTIPASTASKTSW